MEGPGPTCHLPGRGQPRGGLQVGGDGAAGLQGADELPQPRTLLLQLLLVLSESLPCRASWVQAQVQHLGLALVVVTLREGHRQAVRAPKGEREEKPAHRVPPISGASAGGSVRAPRSDPCPPEHRHPVCAFRHYPRTSGSSPASQGPSCPRLFTLRPGF